MAEVACFCGCFYSFDSGGGACPKCGEYASVTTGPWFSGGRSQEQPVPAMNGSGQNWPTAETCQERVEVSPEYAAAMLSATDVNALGSDSGEGARLQCQSGELRPDSAALLDRVGLTLDSRTQPTSLWPGNLPRS